MDEKPLYSIAWTNFNGFVKEYASQLKAVYWDGKVQENIVFKQRR